MRKFLHAQALPLLVLGSGAAGFALQLWSFSTADGKDLLLRGHISQILVWILTAAVIGSVFYFTRSLTQAAKYGYNFPPSLSAAAGCLLGAVGILIAGFRLLFRHGDSLVTLTAAAALVAGLCLIFAGWCRWQGRRSTVLLHSTVCLFFLLLLICQYRQWSAEPQLQTYAFPLLASVFLMVGTFQRACFDGGLGNRGSYAFFRLVGAYFCLAAMAGSELWAFYLLSAVWSAADLCNLTPTRRKGR